MATILDSPERVLLLVLFRGCSTTFLDYRLLDVLDINQLLVATGANYDIVLLRRSRETLAGWRGRVVVRLAITDSSVGVIHIWHILEWFRHAVYSNALDFLIEVLCCLLCVDGFVGVARSVHKTKDGSNCLQWVVEGSGEGMVGCFGFGGKKEGW